MTDDGLDRIMDAAVAGGPSFMKGFMRGFTLSHDYDDIFDKLMDEEKIDD